MSMDFDSKEYLDYVNNGISGKLTRGLVVSNKDPLYSGRVKVWIPTIHGGLFQQDSEAGDAAQNSSILGETSGTDTLASLSDLAISCLPWAPIIGHNWGPTGDFSSDQAKSNFGIFNAPKVGTEVFIIFEDDNPNLPVVMGAAFHEAELIQNSRIKSLEISPGILISNNLTDSEEQNAYPDRVAESYIIQSEKGLQLILSDLDGQEQVRLGGMINPLQNQVVTDDGSPNSKYLQFSNEYPNFPTTASAPYNYRYSINTDNPVIDLNVLRSKPANTSFTSGVPATQQPLPANTSQTVSNINVKKVPPITVPWPKIQVGTYKDFRFDRSTATERRIHLGVDLSVKEAKLVAPIDCIPLAYINSSSAGRMLIVKGIDGYCHAFLHLESVLPQIIQDTNNGIYKKYTVGSELGVTGNSGNVEGSGGGWHLHWEVFHVGDLVKTRSEALQFREILRKPGQGNMKGIILKGQNFIYPYNYVHPLSDWLKSDSLTDDKGNQINTTIAMSTAQLDSFSSVYNTGTTPEWNKVIGIDMSVTTGAESIFIRHPSGAFAGFDVDGNWKVYTPGNAEYKVNRNLVFDVFGGVLTSCLAVYTRAKSVLKLMSTTVPQLLNSIGDATASDTTLPSAFKRIDISRQKDMADALKQSASNAYYTLADSMLGKSLEDIQKDGYAADFNPADYAEKNYTLDTYDTIIKQYHKKYIPTNHTLYSVITPALIKSIMLNESNGDPTAKNGGFVGLFQLGQSAIKDITKQDIVNLDAYLIPDKNIDIGVQYILMCMNIMLNAVNSLNIQITTEEDKKQIRNAALMGYNFGPYAIKNLYKNVLEQSSTLAYSSLEERFVQSDLYKRNITKGKETLYYAPHILYILQKLPTMN